MSEATAQLGVNHHHIRSLIKAGILAATQVVPRAPYQIRASDLLDQRVVDAIARKKAPYQESAEQQLSMFSTT